MFPDFILLGFRFKIALAFYSFCVLFSQIVVVVYVGEHKGLTNYNLSGILSLTPDKPDRL